ncbi:MAG: gliding motility-associated C-terminal domain-containing protein, partial [Bacteroidota bacterium]
GTLISTDQNPILFDLAEGTHQFYLVVESNECVSNAAALTTVEVNAQPVISGVTGSGSYCQGATITLSAVNTIPFNENIIYTWTGPNGFSYSSTTGWEGPFTLVLPNASPELAGTYSLSLQTEVGCTAEVQSVNIDLNATPTTPNLSLNSDFLCEGAVLELNSTTFTGTPVVYEWFFTGEDGNTTLIGTTDLPTFFINNVSGLHSGIYTVQVTVDGCISQPSNAQDVTVFGNITPPQASNSTSSSTPACVGSIVNLSVPVIIGASYQWIGPNGFNSTLPNPVIANVSPADAGLYYAIVELNGCASVISVETEVFVQTIPDSPTIVNDGPWCEGATVDIRVSSPLNIPPGLSVQFDWYYAATNTLMATTTVPEVSLDGLNTANSGDYYVIMTWGDCTAPISEPTMVQVNSIPANEADAGDDKSICASTTIILDAEVPSIGTGFWTSPTGATISNPELPDAEAIDLIEGSNVFVWTLSNGACTDYDADTVIIDVSLNPVDVAFAGNDFAICGNTSTNLTAVVPLLAVGSWSQTPAQASLGVVIVDPSDPNTVVNGLEIGNAYLFTWTLSQGVCEAFASDEVIVEVNEAPLLNAFVFESEEYACGANDWVISALEPSVGTGQWSSITNGVTIIDPLEAETIVDDLQAGANAFVWTLSNGVCENYSADTLVVYREDAIRAEANHYELNFGDSLLNIDWLLNDFVGNVGDWEIKILEEPKSGTLTGIIENGQVDYIPNNGFFGQDRMIYEICNLNCAAQCDTALVTITVRGTAATGDCWVPNIVTPNNDGFNDYLTVPCLDDFPNNELRVYNRWGDRVHLAQPYRNDWEATFNGAPLPAGTYFYILQLDPNSAESLQGYFTVIR